MTRAACAAALVLASCAYTMAQERAAGRQEQRDEVLKIETVLMQAGVTVLDQQGRFIDKLRAEQFEVRVDGKPQAVTFFDRVAAGSADERAKLAAARGAKAPADVAAGAAQPGALPEEGRVVLFFLDDLHMSAESVTRARKAVLHFVDREMGRGDVAAVASASGQLGFLQQLTDNKTVLRAAAARLKPWAQASGDGQLPVMTEYLAQAVAVEGDRDVMETYVQALMRDGMRRPAAEVAVKERARMIIQVASAATRNTLRALGSLVRTLSPVPGRKLVFFFSDGFLLPRNEADIANALYDITDASVRAGFVLYTLDARGLSPDTWLDAGAPLPGDPTGRLLSAARGEVSASQEALRLIAEQTGGRALLNTNSVASPISTTVNETAAYYVLAWQPSEGEAKDGKFRRLEVTVKDRPDLIVLVQRGFRGGPGEWAGRAAPDGKGKNAKTGGELSAALASALPARGLPAHLSLSYFTPPKGDSVLTALFSVPLDALGFDQSSRGALEVEGYVVNLDGKIGSRFKERLSVTGAATAQATPGERVHILYRHQIKLAPGVYQVRAAARDEGGGRVGSAAEWVEIPDLKAGQFLLGSLLVGERPPETGGAYTAENFVNQRSAERRFARAAQMRFMTYIYNAPPGPQNTPPDLEVQIVVLRGDRPVLTDEWRKVETAGADFGRIAYGAEIGLETMPPGRYVLQITVNDRHAKVKASRQADFIVE